MKVEIVNYSKKYTSLHKEFANRNWGKRRRGDPEYLHYKHREKNTGSYENLVIAIVDERVIGQIGLIPTTLVVKDEKSEGFWLCDLMVELEYRKLGVAIKLYKHVMKKGKILFGSSPSPSSEVLLKLLKFRSVKGPKLWFFPIEFDEMVQWRLGTNLKGLQPFFSQIINFFHKFFYSFKSNKNIEIKSSQWSLIYEKHLKFQTQIDQPHILHDKDFLKWRGNGFTGFCEKIMGLYDENSNSYLFYGLGSSCLYIYEWNIENSEIASDMFFQLYKIAIKHKKSRLQLTSNFPSQDRMLKNLGWLKFKLPVSIYYHTSNINQRIDQLYYTVYDSDGNL